jgi:TolB-like protein/Tfp pilus assembly protein PilF
MFSTHAVKPIHSSGGLPAMADVFLSYKREDAAKVRKVVSALRKRGLDVWWDEDIPPSAPWETTIEKELGKAKTVIVCWSPESVASENVRSEARAAREDGRLIQVFVKPCSPPLFFGERQGIDLSSWRGRADDPRIATIVDGVRAVTGEHGPSLDDKPARRWFEYRLHISVALLILLAGSFAGWWLLSPAKAAGPQTLAILPFRALNPADANLVDAIWDDTRGAISRNPNLRVLGRQSIEPLAQRQADPATYRRKLGADYLLDGSVEHVNNQVRMKLSLTRTKDGTEVWSDELGGKLDDVFAFQTRIANEVEGRIRGRVAPGGGATERNIATSGEVYAIFAEARSKIRLRDPDNEKTAVALLRKALSIDPNYAPAWANLGVATYFAGTGQPELAPVRAEAVTYLHRALTLAPNLAYAHAALAMVQNLPPESEGELRKAVTLDPGSADAWTWLGNLYLGQNRLKEALAAQTRAVEIEPLWWTAVGNKIGALVVAGDGAGLESELRRIQETQDTVLLTKAQWRILFLKGHPGDAVAILLRLRTEHPEEAPWVDMRIWNSLAQLGFIEEALRARKLPLDRAAELRGTPVPAAMLDAKYKSAADFWQDAETAARYSWELPTHGRLDEWHARYRSAFRSTDDFFETFRDRSPALMTIAPNVVANLRASGDGDEADVILQRTEPMVLGYMNNGSPNSYLLAVAAYFRAADGNGAEAVSMLSRAVDGGWLPDGPVDLAYEPCFRPYLDRADFQAVRQRILARIADERRKVPVAMLARVYPVTPPSKMAA